MSVAIILLCFLVDIPETISDQIKWIPSFLFIAATYNKLVIVNTKKTDKKGCDWTSPRNLEDNSEHNTSTYVRVLDYKKGYDIGQSICLECKITIVMVKPRFYWYRDDEFLNNSSDVRFGPLGEKQLTLNVTQVDHGKSISCMAFRSSGHGHLSNSVTLNVSYKPIVDPLTDFLLAKGQTVKIKCNFHANPPAEFNGWHFKNVKLAHQKTPILVLKDVKPSDSGKYTCKVKNRLGSISRTAFINVYDDMVFPDSHGISFQTTIWISVSSVSVVVILIVVTAICHAYKERHKLLEIIDDISKRKKQNDASQSSKATQPEPVVVRGELGAYTYKVTKKTRTPEVYGDPTYCNELNSRAIEQSSCSKENTRAKHTSVAEFSVGSSDMSSRSDYTKTITDDSTNTSYFSEQIVRSKRRSNHDRSAHSIKKNNTITEDSTDTSYFSEQKVRSKRRSHYDRSAHPIKKNNPVVKYRVVLER